MTMIDTLYHRGPTRYAETWMPTEEVLQRVAARFPLAIVDRVRADRHVIAEVDQMKELYGPTSHLVELHRKMIGKVAYVTVREEAGGPQFHFFLRQCPTSIGIDYDQEEDREVCRSLLEALAAALTEYDLVSEDPEEPSDLTPDDMPAAVRDVISEMHVRWEGDVAILAAGSHEAGEPFPQEKGARHWCDSSSDLILDLTGFAQVPSGALIEWIKDVTQTAEGRDREIRLCSPPGALDERLTKYFGLVGVPIYATIADAFAAREEQTRYTSE